MKDIIQTLLIAMVIGLVVFCSVIIFDRNSDSIEWNKRAEQVRQEAERTSENVDKYVKKGKRVITKLKEMEEEDISSVPAEPNIPKAPSPKSTPNTVTPKPQTIVSANLPIPNTPNGIYYQLQVGRLSSAEPNLSSFATLQSLGTLSTELNGGDQRVILGNFNNREQADAALSTARSKGFADAFVITRNTATALNKVANKDIKQPTENLAQTTPTTNGIYVVQIVANQFPVSSDYKSLATLGSLFQEKNPDLTKIMLGPFKDEAAARRVLLVVKEKGYNSAFLKSTNWNTLNKWQKIY